MAPNALHSFLNLILMRLCLLVLTLIAPLLSQGVSNQNSLDKNDKQPGVNDKHPGNDKQQGGNDKQPGNDKPLQQNVSSADNQDQPSQSQTSATQSQSTQSQSATQSQSTQIQITQRPNNSSDSKVSDSNSKGTYIALSVVGGVVALAILAVWIFRKLRMKRSESLSRSKTMNIHDCGLKPTMAALTPPFEEYKVNNFASYETNSYCESVVVGPYYGTDSAAYNNGAYYPDPSYNYDQYYNPNYYQEQETYVSYNNQ